MNKSSRNKTLCYTEEELKGYIDKCIHSNDVSTESIVNKTILGDTFEVLDNITEKFDLIIVDPPYNLDKTFDNTKFSKMSDDEYRVYTENWVKKVYGLLKDNGSIYVCCDWKCTVVIGEILNKYFLVRNRITWQREKGRGSKDNWKNCSEDIWYCTKGKDFYFDVDAVKLKRKVIAPYKENGVAKDWVESEGNKTRLTYPSNFWEDITIPFWSMPENTTHPTQKPEKLIAKLILASCPIGGLVLDPFVGSGTTSVVCKKLDRQYVGIERSPLYCGYTEYRLENASKGIQGYNGVFLSKELQ